MPQISVEAPLNQTPVRDCSSDVGMGFGAWAEDAAIPSCYSYIVAPTRRCVLLGGARSFGIRNTVYKTELHGRMRRADTFNQADLEPRYQINKKAP